MRSQGRRTKPIWLLLVAAAGVLVLGSLVDSMIFQPSPGIDLRPQQLGIEGAELNLQTEDGVRIHAFELPRPGVDRALLFLHGNAGNASHRLPNAALLADLELNVLLLDYRGYGASEGSPSEQGVYADARAGLAHLVEVRGFAPERVAVFGRSLGGAVAVDLAAQQPVGAVILESTFTSIADVAAKHFGPFGWLARGRFDSVAKIDRVRAPLLFLHGDRDEIVAYDLGRRLYEAAPEPKAFEPIPRAGHNDTVEVGGRAYLERIRRFLDEVLPLSDSSSDASPAAPSQDPRAK